MEFEKKIGKEAELEIKVTEDKKLRLSVSYEGAGAGAEVAVTVSAEYFVKKLADAIPGEIDDMILNGLLSAL